MVVNGQELAPGKWTTLDDGTVVYCPLEITEDTSVVFNHAGSGGAEAWEYRADYNQPDTIVVLYPSANPEYTAQINEAMEGVVNQLYEGTGITRIRRLQLPYRQASWSRSNIGLSPF